MSAREGFGKAKEGGGLEMMKVGEDETKQFRIFPPKGKLAAKGTYALYLQQHYGYQVRDPKDPTKTRPRPFACVEEKDGDKVIVSCPECRKIEDKQRMVKEQGEAEIARLVGQGVAREVAEKQAAKLVEPHTEWLKSHNLDRKWYLIAMSEDGKIGFLVIPHKAKKMMDIEKKKLLAEEKIDILDLDNGAWVEISRTGKGRNTEYAARIAMEQVVTPTGARAKVTKVSGFTDQQMEDALALPDLDSSSIMRKLTRDAVRLLAEGSGAPEEVEMILNMGQKSDSHRREASPAPVQAPVQAPVPLQAAPVTVLTPQAVVAVDPAAAQIAALQAQLAALQQGGSKPVPVPTLPTAAVVDVKAMSDDEFLTKFGAK